MILLLATGGGGQFTPRVRGSASHFLGGSAVCSLVCVAAVMESFRALCGGRACVLNCIYIYTLYKISLSLYKISKVNTHTHHIIKVTDNIYQYPTQRVDNTHCGVNYKLHTFHADALTAQQHP